MKRTITVILAVLTLVLGTVPVSAQTRASQAATPQTAPPASVPNQDLCLDYNVIDCILYHGFGGDVTVDPNTHTTLNLHQIGTESDGDPIFYIENTRGHCMQAQSTSAVIEESVACTPFQSEEWIAEIGPSSFTLENIKFLKFMGTFGDVGSQPVQIENPQPGFFISWNTIDV